MNEQLDDVQRVKDPKDIITAEELAQRIRDFYASAMTTLNDRREEAYAVACAPFNEWLTALAAEVADIESGRQAVIERVASAEYVKRAEYYHLVVQGQSALAQAKLKELEEVQAEPAKIETRRSEIVARIESLEADKRAALRRVSEDFLEDCIRLIRASETGLALLLDESRANLNNLETQLGVPLYQPAMLTAHEHSSEWNTLNRLYGGRVR